MILRGGTDEERLYLYDAKLDCGNDIGIFKKTSMPDIDTIISRHKARYHLPAFFCRPNMKVLDFPCGSGYGRKILPEDIIYEGRDYDSPTIEYCKMFYKDSFLVDNLINPTLHDKTYDLIACIEGLEHIFQEHQASLIKCFYNALRKDGLLVISTPITKNGTANKYHMHEPSKEEFESILKASFTNVQILSHEAVLHNGQEAVNLYGICRRMEW